MKAVFPLLLAALALQVNGAPAIGVANATPMTAVIGTPTPITVTASISDPSVIANGVNLLQINPNGTTTILGVMHDDGLNGDANAGDGLFTLLVTLNASSPSQVQLQVSAAFKGALARIKSSVMPVFFQSANAPQESIAGLAQSLTAGNVTAALAYVVPSTKTTSTLTTLNQQGLNSLASMLNAAMLFSSQDNLRIFRASFVTPGGQTTTVEFSMVPGPTGQWLINSW